MTPTAAWQKLKAALNAPLYRLQQDFQRPGLIQQDIVYLAPSQVVYSKASHGRHVTVASERLQDTHRGLAGAGLAQFVAGTRL